MFVGVVYLVVLLLAIVCCLRVLHLYLLIVLILDFFVVCWVLAVACDLVNGD